MKTRILLLSLLAVTCTISLGLPPPPKDQCLLSLKSVFQSDDEQVWYLTIETREPTQYRIVSAVVGGAGDLAGDTAKAGHGKCEDGIWIVFSQISPSRDGPGYIKTVLKGRSGSLSQVREIAQGARFSGVVAQHLIGGPSAHRLNIPVVLADMDGQRMRVMVGVKSAALNAEGGAPNAALPRR
jgi:hypothetical protein